jgi:hypothetical protein
LRAVGATVQTTRLVPVVATVIPVGFLLCARGASVVALSGLVATAWTLVGGTRSNLVRLVAGEIRC